MTALALLLAGCLTSHRSVATDVDPEEWAAAAEIVIPNADTLAHCDLSFYLRFDERFRDDTLTLRIEVRTPDSLRFDESFLFCAAHPRRPAAVRSEAAAAYRRRATFARSGDYRFLVTPVRPVAGVEAVGLHIAESE